MCIRDRDTMVTARETVAPWSSSSNLCDSPALFGYSPAFRLSALPVAKSTPSIVRTWAPRLILDAPAGEPPSINATTALRGGVFDSRAHSAPYPACTPDCDRETQTLVG